MPQPASEIASNLCAGVLQAFLPDPQMHTEHVGWTLKIVKHHLANLFKKHRISLCLPFWIQPSAHGVSPVCTYAVNPVPNVIES